MNRRFPIRFGKLYAALSTGLLLPPSRAYVDVTDGEVEVRMGWAFQTKFPRAAVRSTDSVPDRLLSRGVHGWGGRWLVNGSGTGIVAIELEPAATARVLGVPVRLRRLMVSVEDPAALRQALDKVV